MVDDVIKDYFKLNADIQKIIGNINISKTYIDSLLHFEEKMFGSLVDANHEMNGTLLKAETEIETESKKKFLNGALLVALFVILVFISVIFLIYYGEHKIKLKGLNKQESNFTFLKSNNERLGLKLHGL